MDFVIDFDRESDGRWIAEVPSLAGAMAYGATRDEAMTRVQVLALRVLADRMDHQEMPSGDLTISFRAA